MSQPPAAAQASPLIVMGTNDQRQCVDGWHVREADARSGVLYRWTMSEASFRLQIVESTRELHLMASAPVTLTGQPVGLSLYAGGELLCHLPHAVRTEFWTVAEFKLPEGFARRCQGEVLFTLRCEERAQGEKEATFRPVVFIPDLYLHNGDHRRMGVMVATVRAVG